MLLIMAESNIECGFMEGFTEEAQQQDSQMEEQEVMVTESTDAPCNPEETATQEAAAPEANRESLNEEADMHRKRPQAKSRMASRVRW